MICANFILKNSDDAFSQQPTAVHINGTSNDALSFMEKTESRKVTIKLPQRFAILICAHNNH
jgi:hypothetical protein